MDKYQSFSQLRNGETEYSIELCDRRSQVTILAPHGGRIEPHTSEIARLIAGQDCNLFCFNGIKEGCNRDLHITSHRYDEEQALALVQKSMIVIGVHGCTRQDKLVFLGGLDSGLKQQVAAQLELQDIPHVQSVKRFSGIHRKNICNRGLTGKGVQLEISRSLRDDSEARAAIARGVRAAVLSQH